MRDITWLHTYLFCGNAFILAPNWSRRELLAREFVIQLKKILSSTHPAIAKDKLEKAILYFYRASLEIDDWINNKIIRDFGSSDDITRYHNNLIDAWNNFVLAIDYDMTDSEKIKAGRKIFLDLISTDIRIRPKVSDSYIKEGNCHILANDGKVAWHPDEIIKILTEK